MSSGSGACGLWQEVQFLWRSGASATWLPLVFAWQVTHTAPVGGGPWTSWQLVHASCSGGLRVRMRLALSSWHCMQPLRSARQVCGRWQLAQPSCLSALVLPRRRSPLARDWPCSRAVRPFAFFSWQLTQLCERRLERRVRLVAPLAVAVSLGSLLLAGAGLKRLELVAAHADRLPFGELRLLAVGVVAELAGDAAVEHVLVHRLQRTCVDACGPRGGELARVRVAASRTTTVVGGRALFERRRVGVAREARLGVGGRRRLVEALVRVARDGTPSRAAPRRAWSCRGTRGSRRPSRSRCSR